MANRLFNDVEGLVRELKVISGSFGTNSTDDVATSSLSGKGFSVTRVSAGLFKVTFEAKYVDLVSIIANLQLASAGDQLIQVGPYSAANRTLELRVYDKSTGVMAEVQTISFDAVPDAGAWTISYEGVATSSLAFDADAAAIQAALRLLGGDLAACTVSGNYTDGFVVTFAGAPGDKEMLVVADTLLSSEAAVAVSVAETTKGVEGVDIAANANNRVNFRCYFSKGRVGLHV